jgi:spectinomycin phosphotransferase
VREPPSDLPNSRITACLTTDYGLAVDGLTFLPLGHDAAAWVYQATASDGTAYFVKVRISIGNAAGLVVPHFLAERGIERVVAPLANVRGELSARVGDYAVIVYPFVSEETGMLHGMSDAQWVEYGATLRQVHDVAVSPELHTLLRVETFTPDGAEGLRLLTARLLTGKFTDKRQKTLARFYRDWANTIRIVFNRAQELGRRVEEANLPLVLCHADVHTNNVLVDGAEHVAIVDWDETMLAPRERDLMFVVGGLSRDLVSPEQERLFFDGYGAFDIDPIALAYYRYAWAVADIAAYGNQVMARPDLSATDRDEAVTRFMGLFSPGDTVDMALGSTI